MEKNRDQTVTDFDDWLDLGAADDGTEKDNHGDRTAKTSGHPLRRDRLRPRPGDRQKLEEPRE